MSPKEVTREPRVGDRVALWHNLEKTDTIIHKTRRSFLENDEVIAPMVYRMNADERWWHPDNFTVITSPFEDFVQDMKDERDQDNQPDTL